MKFNFNLFTNTKREKERMFMMASNGAILIPMTAALVKYEWVYFALALMVVVSSFSYHYDVYYANNKPWYRFWRIADWLFATLCYLYMVWFAFQQTPAHFAAVSVAGLTLTIIFFFLGLIGVVSYKKTHPFTHILASLFSFLIIFAS